MYYIPNPLRTRTECSTYGLHDSQALLRRMSEMTSFEGFTYNLLDYVVMEEEGNI